MHVLQKQRHALFIAEYRTAAALEQGQSPLDGGISPGKIGDLAQPVNLTERLDLGDTQRRRFVLGYRKRIFPALELEFALPSALAEQHPE